VELPNAAEILLTGASQKRQGTQSKKNRRQMCDHCYIRTLHLEGYMNLYLKKQVKEEHQTWNSNCKGSVASIEFGQQHNRTCFRPYVQTTGSGWGIQHSL